MGLLNFFRSRKVVEEPIKEISFSEADLLLVVKMKEDGVKMGEVKGEIDVRVVEFVSNLKERIRILGLIDLTNKREHERIKSMTMLGLKEYIEQLNRFVEDLGKVDREIEFSEYVHGVNLAVDFFLRNSRKKLGRATILIGKELAETEKLIKVFHKDVNVIIGGSVDAVSKIKMARRLQSLGEDVVKVREMQSGLRESVSDLEKKGKEAVNKKREVGDEFDLFEKGGEYRSWLDEGEAFEKEKQVLEGNVRELRERIDFKLLMNKFHGIPRSLELLKDYRNDFLNALMSDEGFRILDMIEGDEKKIVGESLKNIFEKRQYLKAEAGRYKMNRKREALKGDLERAGRLVVDINKEIEMENKKLMKFVEDEKEFQGERVKIIESVLDGVRVV